VKQRAWKGRAPAKVNLLLRVLAREAGGHHQIETVFQALELADQLRIVLGRPSETGSPRDFGSALPRIALEVEGVGADTLGPPEENLAVRAARLYSDALGDGRGPATPVSEIRVRLTKRIPHGAGLGGGSSDAAAVLRGLDQLHGGALGRDRLVELGGQLGADVAFFVLDAPRALGWGRGHRLLPLGALPRRPVLLALPPESIATPWAYGALAEHREREGVGAAGGAVLDHADLDSWEGMARLAGNAFQPVLEPLRPELAHIRRLLEEAGARPALLSGSGSAVFGLFRRESELREAEEALEGGAADVQVIRTATVGPAVT